MTRHLVTGASGHDGRLLVDRLVAAGEEVVAAVGPRSDPTARAGVLSVSLDVTDTDAFAALVRAHLPDCVHNLAAISSVRVSWDDPIAVEKVNHAAVVAMLDVLETLRPTCRFLQASSSEIYGPVAQGVADEDTPLAPVSPYGESKAAAHLAVAAARAGGLGATNLVLFGHTGPGHARSFVIPTICEQAAEVALGLRAGIELRDPTMARDWGSARDAVRAFELAAAARSDDYVIGTGRLYTLAEVARWALAAVGADAPVTAIAPDRRADFGSVRALADRARSVLGWRPLVALEEEVTGMAREALSRRRHPRFTR